MSPAGVVEADLVEALEALARLRRAVEALDVEAEDRRRRAASHPGGPLDPRAQGLRDAATFHAARLADGRRRLAAAERQVALLRRRVAGGTVRRCG